MTGAGVALFLVALFLVALCLVPALAFVAFERGFDLLTRYERRRPPLDPRTVLPALAADLRRLSAEHDRLVGSDAPGKAARLHAVQLAYDDTLQRAGVVVAADLPPVPLTAVTRLQAEAELTAHGFEW